MTPEERNLIAGVFDRMRQAANAERDAEAERFINEQVRMQPYAPYVMAQSMIVQDQALQAAAQRIKELEQQVARAGGPQAANFAPGGQPQNPYGQRPDDRHAQPQEDRYGQPPGGYPGYNPGQPQAPGAAPLGAAPWGQQPRPGGYPGYNPGGQPAAFQPGGYPGQAPGHAPGGYPQAPGGYPGQQPGGYDPGGPAPSPWGQRPGAMGMPQGYPQQNPQQPGNFPQAGMAPQPQQPSPGGGFLRNAAAMAAGVAGGALLMNSIGSLFGGAKTPAANPAAATINPATGDLANQVNQAQTNDFANQVNQAQTPDHPQTAAHTGQGGSGDYGEQPGYDNADYDDNDFDDGGFDGGDFA